jgi:hypothetical protein
VPSTVLVYDLLYRMRRHFNRRSGFRIVIVDGRARGDRRIKAQDRIIVVGEVGRG